MSNKPPLIIIGASGHAQVIADCARMQGVHHVIGYLDSQYEVQSIVAGYPVLGDDALLPDLMSRYPGLELIIGIGDNAIREKIARRIEAEFPEVSWASLVHPDAVVGYDVTIGHGSCLMAGVVVNTGSRIGTHCIINTRASIDHHNTIGDFATVAPGVVTGGNVSLGEGSVLAIGAIIKHGIRIGKETVVGAGALVIEDLPDEVVAYGAPANIIRTRKKGEPYL